MGASISQHGVSSSPAGKPVDRRTGSPGAWYAAAAMVMLFGVAMPAYLAYGAVPGAPWSAIMLCWVVTFWASLRLAAIVTSDSHAVFRVCFWAFVLVFMGLAPIASMATATWGIAPPPHQDDLLPAAMITVLGLAGYEVGAHRLRGRQARDSTKTASKELSPVRTWLLAFTSWSILAVAFWTLGFAEFFTFRTDFIDLLDTRYGEIGRLVVASLIRFPILVAAVALLVYRRSRPTLGLGPRLATWLTVCLALIAINPVNTPRFIVGTGLLSLWFAATRPTILRQRLLVVVLPLALVVVFPYADFFRDATSTLQWAPLRDQLSGNGDYDAFQQLARGYDMVQARGHTLGAHLLGAILFFIPRSVWPDKPVSTGTDIAEHAGGIFFNVSAPLWVELLVDFGLIGVAIGFFFVGRMLVTGDHRYAQGVSLHSEWWAVIGPLLAFYSIVVYRGSFSSMFPGLLIISLCALALRRRGRTAGGIVGRESDPAGRPTNLPDRGRATV